MSAVREITLNSNFGTDAAMKLFVAAASSEQFKNAVGSQSNAEREAKACKTRAVL